MKTYFSLFSDANIPQNELTRRIVLSEEHDVPDDIVSHLVDMFTGISSFHFNRMSVLRDLKTKNFYGIIFSLTKHNDCQVKLELSVSMLDERLRDKIFLEGLFQSIINNFCGSFPYKQTLIQWDEDAHPCYHQQSINSIAKDIASLLSIEKKDNDSN